MLNKCIVLLFLFLFHSSRISSEDTYRVSSEYLDQTIAEFMKKHDIPGVAVGIVDGKNERILTYGVADRSNNARITENTIFEIASVTKVFTTTALALHVLRGDMALNDPISKYLPDLAVSPDFVGKITLLQLATHTSSLPRVGVNTHTEGLQKIFKFLKNWRPDHPIGMQYAYSNLAFGLLGYALESVEKRPYDEIIKQDILNPLGMYMTFTKVPEQELHHSAQGYRANGTKAVRRPHGYIPGSGALRSTIKDLMKFLKANMGMSGPETLHKAMQFAHEPFFKVRNGFIMGLGWQRFNRDGKLIIDKNGGVSGFTSYIGWIPEKKVGVVILTNKGKARTTATGRLLLNYLAK